MLRRVPDRNIWLVVAVILLLALGYGMALSVLAIFLVDRGFSKEEIGSLAVWFALGIIGLSLPMGALIRRFSARATLVGSLAGYAIAVSVFPYLKGFASVAAIRFVDGACSVGVWVSCETILLSRADKNNKAFVMSLYANALALGYVIGPVVSRLLRFALPKATIFLVAGAVAAAGAVLAVLRLDADARAPEHAPEHVSESEQGPRPASPSGAALLWRIKMSCLATFSYGYFQASVILFLPLYLIANKGVTEDQTIVVPAVFAFGMLAFSMVAGRLGDRHGHLRVMRLLAFVGTLMIAGFIFLDRYAAMLVAVLIAGASLASISPVSLALQGTVAAPQEYSRANAMYNVFYAAGMLLGPAVSSRIFGAAGGPAMLWHLVGLWSTFVVLSIVFARDDPAAR